MDAQSQMGFLRRVWAVAERFANVAFEWIDKSKVVKLVGVGWVVWLALSGRWEVREQREREQQREQREQQLEAARKLEEAAVHGTDREPRVYLDFGSYGPGGNTVCRATNTDSRELFSVSLVFTRFISSNVGVHAEGPTHDYAPDASAAVLRPWETMVATFPAERQKHLCGQYTPPCTLDQRECAIFIRCEVRAHRQYDMKPFVRGRWGALKPDCTEVVSLRVLTQAGGSKGQLRLFWQTDERLLRAFRRIREERVVRAREEQSAWVSVVDEPIEELLEKFPVETVTDPFPWPALTKPAPSPRPRATAKP